jgi:hypothetical protein
MLEAGRGREQLHSSRDHRPGTHLSRCITLPLCSGSGMRCIVRASCPCPKPLFRCCKIDPDLRGALRPLCMRLQSCAVRPAFIKVCDEVVSNTVSTLHTNST